MTNQSRHISIKALNLRYTHGSRSIRVLKGVNFTIHHGEILSIIGDSGSGKSTIAKAFCGLLPASACLSGEMTIGEEVFDLSTGYPREQLSGKKIGLIFQDTAVSLNPMHRILQHFEEIYVHHQGFSKKDCKNKAITLLASLGFEDPVGILRYYPFQLSGGMCQRIAIALVVAMSPALIIADEITSALDIVSIQKTMQLIRNLTKDYGISILFITHDMDVARKYCDRIMVLEGGILTAIPPEKIAAFPNLPDKKNISPTSQTLLQVSHLTKTYNHHPVLQDLSFDLRQGECLGILGQSGSGKSTLSSILSCIKSYDSGSIRMDSRELTMLHKNKGRMIYRDIQLVFQDERGCLNPRSTVRDIVSEPLRNLRLNTKNIPEAVSHYLRLVELDEYFWDRRSVQLSSGQCQRVALARALIVKPKLLILDEMVSALDQRLKWKIIDLLKNIIQKEQLTCMVISHEVEVILALCDRLLFLRNGRIFATLDSNNMNFEHIQSLYTTVEVL